MQILADGLICVAELGEPSNAEAFGISEVAWLGQPGNNVLNRQILPVLNACVECGKVRNEHGEADHEHERDSRRPQWHGWHGFRRGLATNLHDLGVDDKTIQAILRHANVAVTQGCYIKTLDSQSIAAMQQLESLVDVKMLATARAEA